MAFCDHDAIIGRAAAFHLTKSVTGTTATLASRGSDEQRGPPERPLVSDGGIAASGQESLRELPAAGPVGLTSPPRPTSSRWPTKLPFITEATLHEVRKPCFRLCKVG